MASSDKPTLVHFFLIGFVMSTLILAAMAFLYRRDLTVAQADLVKSRDDLSAANTGITTRLSEIDELKSALGLNFEDVGAPGSEGTVLGALSATMTANGRDLQAPNVSAMLTALRTKIDQLETDLASTQQALQSEQDRMLALEAQKLEEVTKIQQSQSGSESNLQKFIAQRDEVVQQKDEEISKWRNDYQRVQQEKAALSDQMDRLRSDYDLQIGDLVRFNTLLRTELDEIKRVSFEKPDGDIRRVDNTTRTVWINLGDSDSLRPQVTFSVYDQDHHGVGRGPEDIKGRVEITRILGPHLSQARILEEDTFRPMAEGDVVYSPVWTAGLIEKFAVVGDIDFDQDGQSDRGQFHNLLEHAGAQLSVEIDDEGYRHPENAVVSQDTKFLVLGHIPDASEFASDDPNRERITRIYEEQAQLIERAQQQGVRVISLNDFLGFMGYKPTQRLFIPGESRRYTLQGGDSNVGGKGTQNPNVSRGQTSELFRRQEDRQGNPVKPGTRLYGN